MLLAFEVLPHWSLPAAGGNLTTRTGVSKTMGSECHGDPNKNDPFRSNLCLWSIKTHKS